ncbi:MAG TPA: ABC transporter substrate-binding protein [Devosiaceae bacterium]|nr:ABC transporter substrate-binding protein [Devosiaceae bacterium]
MLRADRFSVVTFAAALLAAAPALGDDPDPADWNAVLAEARGQRVFFHAWGGAPAINDYIAWVAGEVSGRYGIVLTHVRLSDTAEAVSRVVAEKAAGRTDGGSVDLIWLNGENFASLKHQNLLLSRNWAESLPNYPLVDTEGKPTLRFDFTVPVDGLESPWGLAQLTFYADMRRAPEPPRSLDALARYIAAHRGRFTYAAPPDFIGTTFLKQLLYGLLDDPSVLLRDVAEVDFDTVTAPLWAWLEAAKPDLWRSGRVYAADTTHLKTLLADGEIDIAMTFNPGGVFRHPHGRIAANGAFVRFRLRLARQRPFCDHSVQRQRQGRRDGGRRLPGVTTGAGPQGRRDAVGRPDGAGRRQAPAAGPGAVRRARPGAGDARVAGHGPDPARARPELDRAA